MCYIYTEVSHYRLSSVDCRYIYCQKCFTELAGDRITIGDDPTNTSDIPKSSFKEMKNDHVDYEP